jgi:hypothetical protein
MHPRPFLTALRVLLLGLFVLGGPGLPLIDAVVWHGSGTHHVAGTRLDTTGAVRSHAEVCSLAAPIPVPGPVPCATVPMPALRMAQRSPAIRSPLAVIAFIPDHSARPRAPPLLSA